MQKSWGDICEDESKEEAKDDNNGGLVDSDESDLLELAKLQQLQLKETPKVTMSKRPLVTLSRLQAVKAKASTTTTTSTSTRAAPVVARVKGPLCYCGEPSKIDTVKKHGKHEPIGTEFVSCSSGACKYWFKTPVPDDLPTGSCFCDKPAAVCIVKKPDSPHRGKKIQTCAFYTCNFYKLI